MNRFEVGDPVLFTIGWVRETTGTIVALSETEARVREDFCGRREHWVPLWRLRLWEDVFANTEEPEVAGAEQKCEDLADLRSELARYQARCKELEARLETIRKAAK